MAEGDAVAETPVVEEKIVEKKFQYRTLKDFMIAQFKEMKESMMAAAAETSKYRTSSTKKMGQFDHKINVEYDKNIKSMTK